MSHSKEALHRGCDFLNHFRGVLNVIDLASGHDDGLGLGLAIVHLLLGAESEHVGLERGFVEHAGEGGVFSLCPLLDFPGGVSQQLAADVVKRRDPGGTRVVAYAEGEDVAVLWLRVRLAFFAEPAARVVLQLLAAGRAGRVGDPGAILVIPALVAKVTDSGPCGHVDLAIGHLALLLDLLDGDLRVLAAAASAAPPGGRESLELVLRALAVVPAPQGMGLRDVGVGLDGGTAGGSERLAVVV
mmetsp:Transcript_9734/g.27340  ORF Transcript_9734/g.27340 Transcript_9734/m.27340 type:complete len:243 (-) Transcript_9734:701-1429(-)